MLLWEAMELIAIGEEIDMVIVIVVMRVEVVVDPEIMMMMMMMMMMMKTIIDDGDRAPSLLGNEVGLADDASSRRGILTKITMMMTMTTTTRMSMASPTTLKR